MEDVDEVIERTAYRAANNHIFEGVLRSKQGNDEQFSFLHPSNPKYEKFERRKEELRSAEDLRCRISELLSEPSSHFRKSVLSMSSFHKCEDLSREERSECESWSFGACSIEREGKDEIIDVIEVNSIINGVVKIIDPSVCKLDVLNLWNYTSSEGKLREEEIRRFSNTTIDVSVNSEFRHSPGDVVRVIVRCIDHNSRILSVSIEDSLLRDISDSLYRRVCLGASRGYKEHQRMANDNSFNCELESDRNFTNPFSLQSMVKSFGIDEEKSILFRFTPDSTPFAQLISDSPFFYEDVREVQNKMMCSQSLREGVAYGKKGEYELAMKYYSRALIFDSSNSDVHVAIGAALASQGANLSEVSRMRDLFNQAISSFQDALKINPLNINARTYLERIQEKYAAMEMDEKKLDYKTQLQKVAALLAPKDVKQAEKELKKELRKEKKKLRKKEHGNKLRARHNSRSRRHEA